MKHFILLHSRMIFFFSAALFLLSVLTQMIISNKLAVSGQDLAKHLEKKEALEKDVARLEFENANLASLSYVEDIARDSGFVDLDGLENVDPVVVAAVTSAR